MDNKKVANALLKLAKELVSVDQDKQKSGNKRVVEKFLKENEKTLREDEYASASFKLTGQDGDSKWTNLTVADLKAIIKVLK